MVGLRGSRGWLGQALIFASLCSCNSNILFKLYTVLLQGCRELVTAAACLRGRNSSTNVVFPKFYRK